MPDSPPRLLLVAHGTRNAAGSDTARRIAAAVAHARSELDVRLCFLDVAEPTLIEALAADPTDLRTVLVPMLLSTGYHVQQDIPAAVSGYPQVAVARHLGPHPLLATALAERLREAGGRDGAPTLLVGAGSTRPEATAELDEAARLLAAELDSEVGVATMADDLAALTAERAPGQVATYLLAEGQFTDTIVAAFPRQPVAPPLGTHPAIIELILHRYDDAAANR